MLAKNNYENSFKALFDDSIIRYDPRIVNNFDRFFEMENINPRYYKIEKIEVFTGLINNKLKKDYYDADYILLNKFFNLDAVIKSNMEDYEIINGYIEEGFRKKDFFIVKAVSIKSPVVKNKVFGRTGGIYIDIKPSKTYPQVLL